MATKRKKCESRCESWLFNTPELINVCKAACRDNTGLSREDFLCSGRYVGEYEFMSKYGYDPCPNSGITLDQFREMISKNEPPPPPKQPVTPVPPTKVDIDGADDNDTTEGSNPWLIYAGVGVVLVVVVLLFVIKRKK